MPRRREIRACSTCNRQACCVCERCFADSCALCARTRELLLLCRRCALYDRPDSEEHDPADVMFSLDDP